MKLKRLSFIGLAVGSIAVFLSVVLSEKPDFYQGVDFSSAIHARDGTLLRLKLAKDQRYRLFTTYSSFPQNGIDATLVYEDKWFWHHPGVNPFSLVRATWSTYVTRERAIGASTITMQLARLHFNLNTKTINGKLQQIWHAFQLEWHYEKEEILEGYLNLAPYGGNVEGLGTAALIYFDKPVSMLNFQEAASLAVIPQNPSKRKPGSIIGDQEILNARHRLVELWRSEHEVNSEAAELLNLPPKFRKPSQLPFHAPHFVQRQLPAHINQDHNITSTLDLELQQLLERDIRRFVELQSDLGIANASAMLVDYRSMELVATVGSADFSNSTIEGQVDGTRAKRSPGSTLKPFVYGLAMDQGLIHPMSLMKDAPKRFGVYTPENFDRGFMGPVMAQDALVYSRNVPAIDLLSRVGHETFHQFLSDAGIEKLNTAEHYGLAMILGGNEVTMHELSKLYAMLANGGVMQDIRHVVTEQHNGDQASHESARLISPEASYLVLDMLSQNPRPGQLQIRGSHTIQKVAWKTGTSYAFRDAWSAGVVGPYVLTVWVGNFDGSSNPALVGRKAAAPLFFNIIDSLAAKAPLTAQQQDNTSQLNLRQVEICATTGDLPNKYCPSTRSAWFIPGVSPIKTSAIYRPVWVNSETGYRSCSAFEAESELKVFEFWPSDIARVFKQAGISTKTPPEWDQECKQRDRSMLGKEPSITSPIEQVSYPIRSGSKHASTISFTATTDADVLSLYWFVDDQFIAKSKPDEVVLWEPQPGEYDISVIDDMGRSNSNRILVTLVQ